MLIDARDPLKQILKLPIKLSVNFEVALETLVVYGNIVFEQENRKWINIRVRQEHKNCSFQYQAYASDSAATNCHAI